MSVSTDVKHPLFARVYDRLSRQMQATPQAEHRAELLEGLRGRVIEVGAGNGMNFAHYPDEVTEVVAVEPEPYLRERALQTAREARVEVTVVPGVADRLPAGDAEFDAAVASLVLCSVPDQRGALAEIHRVLRPGGELRFYEHVAASGGRLLRLQRIVAPVWPHLAGGCHLDRHTATAISEAGLQIERRRDFEFSPSLLTKFAAPHTLGIARRPAEPSA